MEDSATTRLKPTGVASRGQHALQVAHQLLAARVQVAELREGLRDVTHPPLINFVAHQIFRYP